MFVSSRLCIKTLGEAGLAEARSMLFVSQNTSIPVPKVHAAFSHKDFTYILMERIPGDRLSEGWVQRSEDSKARILAQLRCFVEQLRSIPPPDGVGVANVDGGPVYDQRLPKRSFWGPFPTIHHFHRALRFQIDSEDFSNDKRVAYPGLAELCAFHNQTWPKSVFTHGDLSSLNVLARGDKVVGIIDWETAAWMPPYWEYTSAWHVNPSNMMWREEVDNFMTPMPYELEMETIRRTYFGDV